MIGLRGIYVDSPDLMGSAWEQALASDVPVVLEVKTDPEVPPLPPHITLQQAKKFFHRARQGRSGRGGSDPRRGAPGAGDDPAGQELIGGAAEDERRGRIRAVARLIAARWPSCCLLSPAAALTETELARSRPRRRPTRCCPCVAASGRRRRGKAVAAVARQYAQRLDPRRLHLQNPVRTHHQHRVGSAWSGADCARERIFG